MFSISKLNTSFNSNKIFRLKTKNKETQTNIKEKLEIILLKKKIKMLKNQLNIEKKNQFKFGINEKNERFIKNDNYIIYY